METIDPRGVAKFDPGGHDWHNLCRGPLAIATYKISKLWALWYQRRRFFNFFSHSKSLETINPRGVAKFDPRGMNGTVYVEDH